MATVEGMMNEPRQTQCQAIRADGKRCQGSRRTGKKFCFRHDPEAAVERKASCRAGAISLHSKREKTKVLPAETPDRPIRSTTDTAKLLEETINQVSRGEIEPRISNAIGYLASIMLRAMEQSNMEKRQGTLDTMPEEELTDLAKTIIAAREQNGSEDSKPKP